MTVPLMNWSRTLRKLRVRPILIYWALIIFLGYLLVLAGTAQSNNARGWTNSAGSVMTCDAQEHIPEFRNLSFVDKDFINRYNCDDPCYNAATSHPFHSRRDVVSRLICNQFNWVSGSDTADGPAQLSCFAQCPRGIAGDCYVGLDGWTNEDFYSYTAGYWGIFPIILLEIFLVLCFGRKSPSGIRDQMFRFFMGAKAMGHYRLQMPEQQKLAKSHNARRVGLAQAGALAFYFLALLVYALCIPLFIFVMAYSEHALNFFPDAEEVYEPGQWLPWVAVILIIGGVVVGRYHRVWRAHLEHLLKRTSKPSSSVHTAHSGSRRNTLREYIARTTRRVRGRLDLELRDLKVFMRHPVYLVLDTSRERNRKDDTVQYSFSGSLPFPTDSESDHKEYPGGSREQEHVFEKGSPHDQPSKKFPVEFVVSADNHTLRSWERCMRLHARHDGDHVYSSPHASADSQSNVLERRARIPASPSLERIVYTIDLPPVPKHLEQRAILMSHTQAHRINTILSGRSRPPDRGRLDTEFYLAEALPTSTRSPATASYAITALPAMASAAPDPTQQPDRRGSTGSTAIRSIHSNHAQSPPPKLKRHNTVVSVRELPTAGKDEHISWTPPSRPLSTASFSRPRHSTTTSVSTMTSNASTSILSPIPASQDAPEVPQLPILRFSTPNSIANVTQPISHPPPLPAPPPKDPAYVALAPPSQNSRHVPSWPKTAAAATTTAPPSLAPIPPMPSSAASRSVPPSPTQGAFSSTAQIMHYYEEPPSSSSLGAAGMRAIPETQPFVMQAPPASKKKALREKGVIAAAAAGTAATPTSASMSASTLVSTPQKPMRYLSKRNASPEDEPLLPDWDAADMPRSPVSPTTMTRERERPSKRTTVDDIEAAVGEAIYPPRKSSIYQFQHQQHHNRQQPLEREEGGVDVTQTAEKSPPQNSKSHLEPPHSSTSPGDSSSSAPTTPQTPSFPDILRDLGGLTRSNTQGTTKT
ncbi:hypothetical protein LTS18_005991, partial [Coniosporium uncinatum]